MMENVYNNFRIVIKTFLNTFTDAYKLPGD